MQYFVLKSLHIIAVVVFLGNVITGVFWKAHGDRAGTLAARAQALDGVIRSDRWFTLPGVLIIIVTGVLLAMTLQLPLLSTRWIAWSLVLFGISGVVFSARVGPLQKKLLANVQAGMGGQWNEAEYRAMSRAWELWGWVATGTPLIALVLMVFKPV
jgi:uncharacterized membrane protein